jgi:hypothetical protein
MALASWTSGISRQVSCLLFVSNASMGHEADMLRFPVDISAEAR